MITDESIKRKRRIPLKKFTTSIKAKFQRLKGARALKNFFKDENGLTTLEYIIGAGIIAGIGLLVFLGLKSKITGASNDVGNAIESAGNQASDAVNP